MPNPEPPQTNNANEPQPEPPVENVDENVQEGSELEAAAVGVIGVDPAIFAREFFAYGEGESLESWRKRSREQSLQEQIDTHDLRKRYTRHLFLLTCIWLSSVLMFVGLTGLKGTIPFPFYWTPASLNLDCSYCWRFYFSLSDKVLIAFITSTTASVIGIFVIVAKWLFPSLQKEADSEKKKGDDAKKLATLFRKSLRK